MKGKKIFITCSICKQDRLVNTSGMTKSSYEKRSPRCHKCGYNKTLSGQTAFKKGDTRLMGNSFRFGRTPWNKNMKGLRLSPQTEFKKGDNLGKLNNKWKGDNVGYATMHGWLRRNYAKDNRCKNCGREGKTDWANISWEYRRSKDDFVELCRRCHSRYDHKLIMLYV